MSGNEFRFWLCVCKHGVDGLGFEGCGGVHWMVGCGKYVSGIYLLERVSIPFS